MNISCVKRERNRREARFALKRERVYFLYNNNQSNAANSAVGYI